MIIYMLALLFMLLFVVVFTLILFSAFVGFLVTRVPFVPTSQRDIELIVQKVPVTAKDVFYDLGSGDGKVVFLVNKLSGADCVGFELTWWTHLLAKIKSKFINPSQRGPQIFQKENLGYSQPSLLQRGGEGYPPSFSKRGLGGVHFFNKNFFKQDWSEATIIYGYLYPPLMARVEEKFRTECKPGTVAIIRDFPLPTLKPAEVINPPPKDYHPAVDTKWNRFKILLKSFWRAGKPMNHEIYIYRLTNGDKLNL